MLPLSLGICLLSLIFFTMLLWYCAIMVGWWSTERHTQSKTRFIVFVLQHTGARVKMDNWESGTTRRRSGYVLSKPSSHGLSGLLSLVAETLLPFAMMARWAPSPLSSSSSLLCLYHSFASYPFLVFVCILHFFKYWVLLYWNLDTLFCCCNFVCCELNWVPVVYMGLEPKRNLGAPSRDQNREHS